MQCDQPYHADCVGLKAAPEGEWFCHICEKEGSVDSEIVFPFIMDEQGESVRPYRGRRKDGGGGASLPAQGHGRRHGQALPAKRILSEEAGLGMAHKRRPQPIVGMNVVDERECVAKSGGLTQNADAGAQTTLPAPTNIAFHTVTQSAGGSTIGPPA
jgi:hypothetical protein